MLYSFDNAKWAIQGEACQGRVFSGVAGLGKLREDEIQRKFG